jgi:uncharacterized protein
MRPSAVLDSSVLVSAFLTPKSTTGALLGAAERGVFEMFLSAEILAETEASLLRHRLVRRYGRGAAAVSAYRAGLTRTATMVRIVPLTGVVPGDPKDDMVVATAVAAKADHLVTGDRRHLLPLGNYRGIAIVTPRAFLDLLAPG